MLMDGFFCAGGSVGIITTPLFLPSTPFTFGVNWTPPPRQKARPPSRGTGFLFPAGHSPRAEHTAATATQSRKPSRFFRAFSGLRSCFQPLPTLPPVDTKKGQGVREHPPPGGTVPRIQNPRSFAPVESSSSYRGRLLSTVQPVGKQGHHDARHGLRGCVQ